MKKVEYINAGAGSGKTYTLTTRLAKLMRNDGIQPSQIIVTTYTKAAAAEIKERVRQELLKDKDLIRQATQLDSAAIGTVHSVCQQFMKRYWFELGISPDQEVITEEDAAIYRNDALARMMEGGSYETDKLAIDRFYATFRPTHFINNTPQDYPDFWAEMVEKTAGKATYYGIKNLDESETNSCKEINDIFNIGDPISCKDIEAGYVQMLEMLLTDIDAFCKTNYTDKVDKKSGEPKAIPDKWSKLRKEWAQLKLDFNYANLNKLYKALTNTDVNKNIAKDIWSASFDYEAKARQVSTWLRNPYFSKIITDCIHAIFSLTQGWLANYAEFKRQRGVIDYDDMEMYMLQLLENEQVRKEIAQTYQLVMVDEFQDCNPVQLRIFRQLSDIVAENSVLPQSSIWVGDPKQAIYGFRGSDTELINRVAAKFPANEGVADGDGLLRGSLKESWRSHEVLVNLANQVFADKGIFPGMQRLTAHNPAPPEAQTIYHWQFEHTSRSDTPYYRNVATRVKALVEDKHLNYSDVAILCRTNTGVDKLVDALKKEQVPVSAPEKEIFDKAEVQLVLAVLNWAEQKEQPHEVASILKLWNGLSTEEVLNDRAVYCKEQHTDETWMQEDARLAEVRSVVAHLKGKNISERISTIILELGLYDHVKRWGDAADRRQNLMTLQNVAAKFLSRCTRLGFAPTSSAFSSYLQTTEMPSQSDPTTNTVKVLTYHRSKGLEWKVVIMATLDADDLDRSKLLGREFWGVHESPKPNGEALEDGLLPEYTLYCLPNPYTSSAVECIDNLLWSETNELHPLVEAARTRTQGEMSRLLYVGMTRARSYLITVSKGTDDKSVRWLADVGILKTEPDYKNIWAVPTGNALCVFPFSEPEDVNVDDSTCQVRQWPERYDVTTDKYQSPSTMHKDSDAPTHFQLVENVSRRVPVTLPADLEPSRVPYSASAFGTCIHNIYAAEAQPEQASAIISNFGLSHVLQQPEPLVQSLTDLYAWLTRTYGAATQIVHEYPFTHALSDGQIVSGEIDLIWQTAKGAVIVDFKTYHYNFAAGCEGQPTDVVTSGHSHYAGTHYSTQLNEYRKILEQAGIRVQAILLYYNMMGCAVVMN